MDKILHDPKDPKLWELWYIPSNGYCRILSINRSKDAKTTKRTIFTLRGECPRACARRSARTKIFQAYSAKIHMPILAAADRLWELGPAFLLHSLIYHNRDL